MRGGLLALLLGAAAAAAQQPAAPPAGGGGGFIASVEAGFDGAFADGVPSPVWVTVTNPGAAELTARIVARSGAVAAEETLVLPQGARRRVALALAVEDELLVEVARGEEVLDQRRLEGLQALDGSRHLLVIDGRPPDRRAGVRTRRDDPSLRVTTIDATWAPAESSAYCAFGAVALRETDPGAWTLDQREALLEHVREGGTLLLLDAARAKAEQARLLEALPGQALPTKLVGRGARWKRVGLGRVVVFADDPVAAAFLGDDRSADTKQKLGDLAHEAAAGRPWPPRADQQEDRDEGLETPGAPTRAVVGAYLIGYLLAVGPLLGLALRRATRTRLAVATAALILGFTLLAPIVAGVVSTGAGVAYVRTIQWVPRDGPAIETGEVVVCSGGATAYDIELSGAQVAGTAVQATTVRRRHWGANGWEWTPERPLALRTRRGDPAAVRVAMPPWGVQRVLVQALRADLRPLDASLRGGAAGVATIHNTTGAHLRDAIIIGDARDDVRLYVPLGTLLPGERRTVALPRSLPPQEDPRHEALGIPEAWTTWLQVAPSRFTGESSAAGWRVVSRAAQAIRAGGKRIEEVAHSLRIDPIVAGYERGYLGATLDDVSPGTYIPGGGKVRLVRLAQNGPAAQAGLPPGGIVVQVIAPEGTIIALKNADHLRAVLARRVPGDELDLQVYDPATRQTSRVKVRLAPRGGVGDFD